MPAFAPKRQVGKRPSEVGGALLEMLGGLSCSTKKRDIVAHFEGRYSSSAVYRELKKLVDSRHVLERNGLFSSANERVGAEGAN